VNRIGVMVQAEFLRRIRSRPFLIGTALGALSIVITTILPLVIAQSPGESKRIILIGPPRVTAEIRSLIASDYHTVATFEHLDAAPNLALLDAHNAGDAVVVTRDRDGLRAKVYARDSTSFGGAFARDVAPLQIALATGLHVSDVKRHLKFPVDVIDVAGRFASVQSADAAKGVAFLFIILLYVAILINAQVIMSSVAEEKTSRIAEVLVATVDPAQLLAAKVIASGVTGFVQLLVWVLAGAVSADVIVSFAPHTATAASTATATVISTSPLEIASFIAFFLLGFAQYSVLYAAAASLISKTEDLGAVAGPVLIPVVIGFVVAGFAIAAPANPWIIAASQFPLLAPFVMFGRIAVSDVPAWQIVTSLAINVFAAVALAFGAGRVYRVGLLMYGRLPSARQVWNALRA
jgi:ABC-2 type transport system permease protein